MLLAHAGWEKQGLIWRRRWCRFGCCHWRYRRREADYARISQKGRIQASGSGARLQWKGNQSTLARSRQDKTAAQASAHHLTCWLRETRRETCREASNSDHSTSSASKDANLQCSASKSCATTTTTPRSVQTQCVQSWIEGSRRMSNSGDDEDLRLTLSPPTSGSRRRSSDRPAAASSSSPVASYTDESPQQEGRGSGSRGRRSLAAAEQSSRPKEEEIEPPFRWATNRRAVVYSLEILGRAGIQRVEGEVMCKRCDGMQMVDVDLETNFLQISSYFLANKDSMHDRAPKMWMVPRLLDCSLCHQVDCVKPVIDGRKRHINWLFLLLTQTLGLCTLDQLKYFCKHNKKHRTGAKDRVLYLTYLGLLKQLNPAGPYD